MYCDTDDPLEMCHGCYHGGLCHMFHWKRTSYRRPIFQDFEVSTLDYFHPSQGGTWRSDPENIMYWVYQHSATRARARVARTRGNDA